MLAGCHQMAQECRRVVTCGIMAAGPCPVLYGKRPLNDEKSNG